MIQETIESKGKGSGDLKLRKFLQDLSTGKAGIELDAESISFATKFRTSLNSQDFIRDCKDSFSSDFTRYFLPNITF